jgi:MFS family permease
VVAPLDSAVNAAFPAITAAFGLAVAEIRWVIVSYLVAFSSCVIVSGRLGDLYGYRRVFGFGLLLSAAAFLACGLAPTYGWLLAARTVQGVGIALVLGVGPALALSIHPDSERTRVLAKFGASFAIGLAVGPVAGGALIDAFGWQSVYLARVPIALAAWLLLARVPVVQSKSASTFDAAGSVLLAVWSGSLLLAIALPGALSLGFGLVTAATFWAFVRRETSLPHPLIRLSLFLDARFSVPNVGGFLCHFCGFAVFLLGPYLFVRELGLSAQLAGILLALSPASAAVGSMLGGGFALRLGPRPLAFAGMVIELCGVAIAAWGGNTGITGSAVALMLQGLGIGLFQVAYQDIVISSLPLEQRGVASSLTNFIRTLGVVSCAAVGSALFTAAESKALAENAGASEAFLRGYEFAFGCIAVASALILALTLARPRAWFLRN